MSSSKISRVISTSSGGNEYRIIDMILIGSGIIIICLLVYIYNQFIHKRYNKNEYFDGRMVEEAFSIQPCHSDKLVCDACSNGNDKLVCEKCPNGRDETTGVCNPSIT
jgi:hypothetical protein